MSLFEELKELGVNIEEGMDRMMGNAALYERMLGSFVKVMKASEITPDFDEEDYADIIEKAHTLKGTSGNLSLTPIYEAYSEILALLRGGQPGQAKEVLTKVLPVQKEILQCIERHL